MSNEAKALFWVNFILEKCQFPNIQALKEHLVDAQFLEFCQCGCNSFKVQTSGLAKPIATTGGYGVVFETSHYLKEEGKTLEILLFAGRTGAIEFIEVDCCANSCCVPEVIEVIGQPFHINISNSLLYQ